jgi:hypothetical protein
MVPWDTFEQSIYEKSCFFGKLEKYATVYGFIRDIAGFLNGYERAYDYSTREILTDGVCAGQLPLRGEDTDNEVCAFIRVHPHDRGFRRSFT